MWCSGGGGVRGGDGVEGVERSTVLMCVVEGVRGVLC